jgi:hypothetical protein
MEIITVYYGVEVIDVKTENLKQKKQKTKKNKTIKLLNYLSQIRSCNTI